MISTNPAAAPMTPGTYIRKRRQAAGLELDDVAIMIGDVAGYDPALNRLRRLEGDEVATDDQLGELLGEIRAIAFNFDPDVYHALVRAADDPSQAVPPICRKCGCTWHDACRSDGGTCAWAEPDLCTVCDRLSAARPDAGTGAAIAAGVLAFALVPGHWLLATAGAML